ncbi:dnaJ homolog subfamily C member 3b [Cyprinodon tularosa]|uniref:dnaJ homolog subfamily C member 3b n=1 Tax=Cyprinodon tularosa TaxID=77115 RepID=UPI0018E20D79|nr:dnaJ homolog subfamily C member 3b [Cyprinodon tularosa]
MEWCLRAGGSSGLLCSLALLCVLLDIQLDGVLGATQAEIEHHLEMGRKLLAAGQLAEALSHYHSAVEGDSENYLTYYKRAAVFLAMGRSRSALPDLTHAIQLKPDFLPARLQRGNILLKQGNTQEAREDFEMVLRGSADHSEAQEQLMKTNELEELQEEAHAAYHQGDYSGTINALERVIEISPWDPESRELRADCYMRMGDPQKAIQDLTPAARLRNDNRAAFLKLSKLHYSLGEHHESLNHIRECLKLDQDDKECFSHYKQVKKLSKQLDSAEELINEDRYQEAIDKYESVMKTEPNVQSYINRAKERICFCLVKLQLAAEAIDVCSEAHQRDPRNANVLRDRAEAYILNQDYEKAVEDYQEAREFDGDSIAIKDGLERAQKLLKISRKRDYYKILGVSRNANKQEIIKAYRKLAQQFHPDNFKSEAEKKEAEKKFIDIASAKEVLTDPEMRQKFDEGEDPLDPESQQGGGQRAWPFHFNPFESGGSYHFKFEYN